MEVKVEVVIHRPVGEVAKFAMNSDNEPSWIGGISESVKLTNEPLGKGSKVRRVASFLGKRIEYVNEVTEYEPDQLLVMHSVSGPFPMTVRYQFEEVESGTLAKINLQGDASGYFKVLAPVVTFAAKRRVTGDLNNLKAILESRA